MEKEEWNICPPHWEKKNNFKCFLINTGLWRREEDRLGTKKWGKWLFLIEPKGTNTCPSLGDQRNFFTGLFEAEWRNDNFIFEDGQSRPPQRQKKIDMFKDILEKIENRADVKNTDRGIDYYLKQWYNGND